MNQLIGRAASTADVQAWANPLLADAAGTLKVLFDSGETDLRPKYIVRLYRLLKRRPEYSRWVFQRNAMADNDTTDPRVIRRSMISNFVTSADSHCFMDSLTTLRRTNRLP